MSVELELWNRMGINETFCPKRSRASTRLFASAYLLWEQEGCPESRADEYWHRAHDQHVSERAYLLWQQEGCPEGRADEYWHRTREFEKH
jgi:hypothetical protein